MVADVIQCERSNIKCYASAFSIIQNIDEGDLYSIVIESFENDVTF